MDDVWRIQRELEGNVSAVRVSNDVGPLNAHMFQERAAVRRHLRHAYRGIKMGAAGETAPVIQKQLASFRQRGFCQEFRPYDDCGARLSGNRGKCGTSGGSARGGT